MVQDMFAPAPAPDAAYRSAMRITVNSEARDIPEGTTVAALIEELGLASAICAAEVNKAVVPKASRAEHTLHEGDTVEIVTLVGGG